MYESTTILTNTAYLSLYSCVVGSEANITTFLLRVFKRQGQNCSSSIYRATHKFENTRREMDEIHSKSMCNYSSTHRYRRINYTFRHQKLRKHTFGFLQKRCFHSIHLLQHSITIHFLHFLIRVHFYFDLSLCGTRFSTRVPKAPIIGTSRVVRLCRSVDAEFWLCSVFCVEGQ